ncbi:MAG: recombinase family protein [Sphingomonadales bacterium]|nr:recombinase family protein [Sphingomonadales bacterium]
MHGAEQSPTRRGPTRCAIYCRKSTEEGLDQAFNSLDAQQEACAAYITSQRHEGWTQVKTHYADGGFSGGNIERPALRRLLDDVKAGVVDVIVVYKVDRLTRSLSDFAKIVDILDSRGASFVSVTQSFNTTTSMGRLTLNVLLSFAQFEREVTGERIRDKFAASKRKGMWMGGVVPLGYKVEGRKLVIVEEDAAIVRHIFTRYAELGSGRLLVEELRAEGYRTKVRQLKTRTVGGIPFGFGMLFNMLSNRTYRGEISHKGEIHQGEQQAIIDEDLWTRVHDRMASNQVARVEKVNGRNPSLLAGVIFDGLGRRMSPSHSKKQNKRFRYYLTRPSEIDREGEPAWSVPAHEIETRVIALTSALFDDHARLGQICAGRASGATETALAFQIAKQMKAQLAATHARHTLLGALIAKVTIGADGLRVVIDRAALLARLKLPTEGDMAPVELVVPIARVRRGQDVRLVITSDSRGPDPDTQLISLLREARTLQLMFRANPDLTILTHAQASGQCRKRLARLMRLSWLSPQITEAILAGRQPSRLTARRLIASDIPECWRKQADVLGFN